MLVITMFINIIYVMWSFMAKLIEYLFKSNEAKNLPSMKFFSRIFYKTTFIELKGVTSMETTRQFRKN